MTKYRAIPQGFMTVGEVAKKMGVTVRTLQYYDKEGLLSPSAESEGGRRLYTDKDLVMLHQIISLKSLGFSLDDIKERLISLETPADVANFHQFRKHAHIAVCELHDQAPICFDDLLAFFAFRRDILLLKLYDLIAQAVESVHKIQAAFLIEPAAYMVERIIVETLDQRIKLILHLQIDDDIGILLKADGLHLQNFCF